MQSANGLRERRSQSPDAGDGRGSGEAGWGWMKALESVGIRRADAGDIEALERVEQEALPGPDAAAYRDWRVLFHDGTVFTYLAEDKRPFGFVIAGAPREDWFADGITGEVISLCVLPDYQGHGAGRRLLVHGISVLKRRHFESALIWLRDDAERALRLIESLGFAPIESVRTINTRRSEVRERAYKLSLDDYF